MKVNLEPICKEIRKEFKKKISDCPHDCDKCRIEIENWNQALLKAIKIIKEYKFLKKSE